MPKPASLKQSLAAARRIRAAVDETVPKRASRFARRDPAVPAAVEALRRARASARPTP